MSNYTGYGRGGQLSRELAERDAAERREDSGMSKCPHGVSYYPGETPDCPTCRKAREEKEREEEMIARFEEAERLKREAREEEDFNLKGCSILDAPITQAEVWDSDEDAMVWVPVAVLREKFPRGRVIDGRFWATAQAGSWAGRVRKE